ncbi:MAG: nuclear transport factor 2 family protein [Gemmatimonadota bacterium]
MAVVRSFLRVALLALALGLPGSPIELNAQAAPGTAAAAGPSDSVSTAAPLPSTMSASSAAAGIGRAEEVAAVSAVAQLYLDGLLHGDVPTLERAFDPDAMLIGARADQRLEMTFHEWAESRRDVRLEPASDYRHRIISVDIDGPAAMVKVDLAWPDVHYVDYLSLLRIGGEWKIVNKIWMSEPSAAGIAGLADLPLTDEAADRYAGRYEGEDHRIRVFEDGEWLWMQVDDELPFELLHQGDHEFIVARVPRFRLVVEVVDGRAERVTLTDDDGTTLVARRSTAAAAADEESG